MTPAAVTDRPCHTPLSTGGGGVQHRERSPGADSAGENHGILREEGKAD